jgi:hypothetical protein
MGILHSRGFVLRWTGRRGHVPGPEEESSRHREEQGWKPSSGAGMFFLRQATQRPGRSTELHSRVISGTEAPRDFRGQWMPADVVLFWVGVQGAFPGVVGGYATIG